MADLKKLQERSSEIVARMESVRAIESLDADKIAERDLELESLIKESSDVSKKIAFEQTVLEAIKNSRSVVERCSPAPTAVAKTRISPMPLSRKLRAFENVDDAYAAGKWLQGYVFKNSSGSEEARSWCMASMGPRLLSRGECLVVDVDSNKRRWASMGPRLLSRGEERY